MRLASLLLAACGIPAPTPAVLDVHIDPATPDTTHGLTAVVSGASPNLTFTWMRDGAAAGDTATIAADATTRGERWTVTVTDGAASGTAEVVIANAPPAPFEVTIGPAAAWPGENDLRCEATPADPDGDALNLAYAWTAPTASDSPADALLPRARVEDGTVWTCTVTATDGQGGTTTASAARAIVRRTPIRTVRLPPGTFWMGAPEDEPGRAPQDQLPQRVELTRPFELAMTELTHEEYRAITGKAAPSDVDGTCPACPAQGLSWIEFANFTNELSTLAELPPCYTCDAFACTTVAATGYECEGYRMPASAEWEYAARSLGTVVAAYPNGQDLADFDPDSQNCYDERLTDGSRLGEQAWFCGSALPPPQPVAGLLPNPVGLFDMSGNGGEWLGDAANLGGVSGVDPWKAHRSALGIQSTWYAGGGGSAGANNVRIASRNYWYHTDIANNVGLRIARTLPPGTATLPPPAGAQP